ncbi:alpha-xenorhabdolysin family binary toxin subunit B [Pseudomonas sp. NPDC096917]|uniref:alpha-xenorhabdolysin family binary toxin subunit B n=1 Tax=Pseudomonas sp. NPDC096917 TaxID=3364483 RepID=UPI00383B948A
MNGITRLSLYPFVDSGVIKKSLRSFDQAALGNQFSFIPNFQERVVSARTLLRKNARTVASEIVAIEVALSNFGLNDIAAQWEEICHSTSLAEPIRKNALAALIDVCKKRLINIMTKVERVQLSVKLLNDEIRALTLEHFSNALVEYDASRLEGFLLRDSRLVSERDELLLDKQALEEASVLLGTHFWIDQAKDLLPTPAELEVLVSTAVVPKVDAQLIGVVLGRLSKYVDLFGSVAKRASLTQAIVNVSIKIADNAQARKDNNSKVQELKERKEKMDAYEGLLLAKTNWLSNSLLFQNAWQSS